MSRRGCVPEELAIFLGCPAKLSYHSTPRNYEGEVTLVDDPVEVVPAFAVDSAHEKDKRKAEEWAADEIKRVRRWTEIDRKLDDDEKAKILAELPTEPRVDNQRNIPLRGYRVLGIEERGNGGRAYKVASPDNYLFDLREDVVFSIMMKHGIERDGYLPAELIWVKMGNHMRLTCLGSTLHQEIAEYQREKEAKKNV